MTLVEPRPAPPVEQEERGGWITPSRVGWAGVVLACLAFFVALPPILIRSPIPTVDRLIRRTFSICAASRGRLAWSSPSVISTRSV